MLNCRAPLFYKMSTVLFIIRISRTKKNYRKIKSYFPCLKTFGSVLFSVIYIIIIYLNFKRRMYCCQALNFIKTRTKPRNKKNWVENTNIFCILQEHFKFSSSSKFMLKRYKRYINAESIKFWWNTNKTKKYKELCKN